MLRLNTKISFITERTNVGTITLNYVHEASTSESWENLTDTFTLTFPRNINREGLNIFTGADALFQRGDKVIVEHGYYPRLNKIFEGYITDISSKIPITIKCDDEMYLLKNTNIIFPTKRTVITNRISKKGKVGKRLKKPRVIVDTYTLDDLLDEILPDYIFYECVDKNMLLAKRAYTNVSVTKILDDLRSTYGLYSYFRENEIGDTILHVGFASDATTTNTVEFEFENNIIDDSSLEYQLAENVFYRIVMKVMNENNEVREFVYGDTDGAQRTFHLYEKSTNPLKEADIKKAGEENLNELKYTGYKGSFMTFGEPYVKHGDIVKLTSKKMPERNGNYLVKQVKRTWGMNGSRQEVFIDQKV